LSMNSLGRVTLAEKTIVDRVLEEGGVLRALSIDKRACLEEAREIEALIRGEYDANVTDFGGETVPIVIVRLRRKTIIYVVPLPPGYTLTGVKAVEIVESLLKYIEKVKDAGFKPVILFFSKKGKLTMAGYLYLGSVIENHDVGVLFVNGDRDEILEILWHLENVGKYEAPEDEIVDLAQLK